MYHKIKQEIKKAQAGMYHVKKGLMRQAVLLLWGALIQCNTFSQYISPMQNATECHGFLKNSGQLIDQLGNRNTEVQYLLAGPGMNVQLRKNGFSYDTYETQVTPERYTAHAYPNHLLEKHKPAIYHFHRVDIVFEGANPTPEIFAEEETPGMLRYYNSMAATEITAYQYRRVRYREIYHHIDVVFESQDINGKKGFEYYFVVKPGGDVNKITLSYKGAPTQLAGGRIIIQAQKGSFSESIPGSYILDSLPASISQLNGMLTTKVHYRELKKGQYGFSVTGYSKSKTLVIDPTPDLAWGTYYGGGINDYADAIARDNLGNILVAGASDNPGMATSGAYQTSFAGITDAMVGKFQSNGQLIWMTYYGGSGEDYAIGIATNNNGDIYFTGTTNSAANIATPGSHQPTFTGIGSQSDGFLVKLSTGGSRIWGTYYGGNELDFPMIVRTNTAGEVYMAGWTHSTNGIATPGSFQPVYGGGTSGLNLGDGFIARFTADGTRIWATYYGGPSFDRFYGMALDNNNNIYLTGITSSPSGITTPGAYQTSFGGAATDAFLVKFDNTGQRIWGTYYGGSDSDHGEGIACDNQNDVIFGGVTQSLSNITTPGSFQPVFGGAVRDGFLAKFNAGGSRLWATYYGGNGEEFIHGVTCDQNNNILFGGGTYSTNNIATANAYQSTGPTIFANWTAFLAKMNSTGNRIWGTYYGQGNNNSGRVNSLVTDNPGNVFVCGTSSSTSGIASCNAVQPTHAGNLDMFVAMFSENIQATSVSVTITAAPGNTYCSGSPNTFNAIVINGGSAPLYQWKVNGVNSGGNNAAFTTSALNTGDQVSCTVTSNSPCVSNNTATSNSITVTINPSVVPSVSILANITGSICTGTPVTFTATPVNGGTAPGYQWKINGINIGANSAQFTTNTLANGDVISCTLTNLLSCNPVTTAASNSIIANVSSTITPSVTISTTQTRICAGTPVTFNAFAQNAGNSPGYQWKVNGTNAGTGAILTLNSLSNNDTVQCFLTPDNTVCSSSSSIPSNTISIQVNPVPVITITPDNPVIQKGDSIQLLAASVPPGNVSYLWTPNQYINNNSTANPRVWPPATQTYNIQAVTLQGCAASKQVTVQVVTGIWIPSAFSPNNDGINDRWDIRGLELYPGCRVRVFNRYGQLVFQSNGYTVPWNGTTKGIAIQPGTYVYQIELNKGKPLLSGTVTVIR